MQIQNDRKVTGPASLGKLRPKRSTYLVETLIVLVLALVFGGAA